MTPSLKNVKIDLYNWVHVATSQDSELINSLVMIYKPRMTYFVSRLAGDQPPWPRDNCKWCSRMHRDPPLLVNCFMAPQIPVGAFHKMRNAENRGFFTSTLPIMTYLHQSLYYEPFSNAASWTSSSSLFKHLIQHACCPRLRRPSWRRLSLSLSPWNARLWIWTVRGNFFSEFPGKVGRRETPGVISVVFGGYIRFDLALSQIHGQI